MNQPRIQKINSIDIAGQLCGVPLMVTPRMAEIIGGFSRSASLLDLLEWDEPDKADPIDEIAVIDVFGGMAQRSWWRTSYEAIRADFRQAMADPEAKAILLNLDTPGGTVAGCFDLADEIRAARDEKPVYAFVNEQATSAGYLLASGAREIFTPRTGMVGSIGVVMVHAEFSKMDEAQGVKISYIYAGDRKIDFNDAEPLSDEARASGQASVDRAYDLFTKTVAVNRGLTVDTVRNTQAAIYEGGEAMEAGLIDGVMSFDSAVDYIQSKIKRRS